MPRSNYVVNDTVQFQVLSRDQCEEIHYATMEVLEDVGVLVHDQEALDLLKTGGAFVDGNRVRLPAALVEKALRSAPSRIVLCDRNGNRRLFLEGNNFYFGPGPTNTFTIDPYTGEKRKPTIADTRRAALVIDGLPNIDYQMDLGTPQDVPPTLADVYAFEAMLTTSPKPIVHWGFGVEGYRAILDMAVVVAGSLQELQNYPFVCLYSEPTSPLQHSAEAIQKLMFMSEHNLPVIYTPAPMAGATSPVTMAATVVMSNAESLSGLVVSQLKREGAPFIMGGVITIMDMQSSILSYAAPEFSLLAAALTDMAHFYKLPMFSTAGCSDSKVVDQQAAVEAAISCLTAALSGANLIHDVGYIEYGSTSSLAMLAIGDEIIGMVKRIVRGIRVDEQSLALDVIKKVGPGGHFLGEDHTFRHFRSEMWLPRLINRQRFDSWVAGGSTTMLDRANERVRDILEHHAPEPLPADVQKRLREIVDRADSRAAR